MKYKVKVPDPGIFIKTMRVRYSPDWGNVTVKLTTKRNVISIKQKGNGLNLVDVIDSILEEHGGEYVI
jgi:hypothetical protein